MLLCQAGGRAGKHAERECYMYMYAYIYSSGMDIYKNYTVIMKIIIYSVEISSPIGTISNSEVVNLQ